MAIHLICAHQWGPYKRGDRVTDPQECDRLISQRDKHFVRVAAPDPAPAKAARPRREEIEVNGVEFERVAK